METSLALSLRVTYGMPYKLMEMSSSRYVSEKPTTPKITIFTISRYHEQHSTRQQLSNTLWNTQTAFKRFKQTVASIKTYHLSNKLIPIIICTFEFVPFIQFIALVRLYYLLSVPNRGTMDCAKTKWQEMIGKNHR